MTDSNSNRAVLITMPHSHYAEKARWALDWLSLPYTEEPHVPLLHWIATTRNGGRSVPVLVHGARRFIDSTDIMVYADSLCGGDRLYPRDPEQRRAVETLEEQFDEGLGPHTRRWAYAQLLPDRSLLRKMMSRGVPRTEANLLPIIMPIVIPAVRAGLRITSESAQRSLQRVYGLFQEVDKGLNDGRHFLVGERFTAADLTFASLAAPVLLPAGCRAAYPEVDEVPATMREEVLRLRDTEAGRFVLRLFSQERVRSQTVT
jgi:glutathione S-transferase